jgi:hypothetical protein
MITEQKVVSYFAITITKIPKPQKILSTCVGKSPNSDSGHSNVSQASKRFLRLHHLPDSGVLVRKAE